MSVAFLVRSRARTAQDLLLDLAVHFVKANGRSAPKVFKLTRVSLAVHSTRTPRPGRHAVDVIVNGRAVRLGAFYVNAK